MGSVGNFSLGNGLLCYSGRCNCLTGNVLIEQRDDQRRTQMIHSSYRTLHITSVVRDYTGTSRNKVAVN